MGPQNDTTPQAADDGLHGLTPPANPARSVPQHTLGATGRIWSLPARYCLPLRPKDPPQFFPDNRKCVTGLMRFLGAHAPDLLSNWSSALHPINDSHAKVVMKCALSDIEKGGVLHLIPERPSQPAPRDIELPTLDEKHWAWAAHYELGHGKSVSDNFARDCGWEANDDLGHIRYYLRLYKALAQDYSGSRLEAATWAPQFRGSYYTCMDICLKDLQLPSHFIALIHYGIAVQMVHIASSAPSALVVLDRLVDMYREDFAG